MCLGTAALFACTNIEFILEISQAFSVNSFLPCRLLMIRIKLCIMKSRIWK